jgi:hypothetical protein
MEFHLGVGNLAELPAFCDEANTALGELHPEVWNLYSPITETQARELLAKIAREINGFEVGSWDALPYAKAAFKKILAAFLAKKIKPNELCRLVHELDIAYAVGAANSMQPPKSKVEQDMSWLGNLWNCCDWCDETWTLENSEHLVKEVQKVLLQLA